MEFASSSVMPQRRPVHWYQFTFMDHSITATIAWWVPVVSVASIVAGVFLFRAAAVGGLPWIFSKADFGYFGRKVTRFVMLPSVVVMVVGGIGLWRWWSYKFQIDDQGIYWRKDSKVQQGTWDRLWDCKIYRYGAFHSSTTKLSVTLDFFQGDMITLLEDEDWGENFAKVMDVVVQHVQAANLKEQQRRLLDEARHAGTGTK
jgi:hypothetical protein